jgi:hypothetical protein
VSEERALLASDAAVREKTLHDQRLYSEFRRASLPDGAKSFTALEPPQRARYLRLWGQSGFNGKQQFYHATKRLVLVTAYSLGAFWQTIGYAGPLLAKKS